MTIGIFYGTTTGVTSNLAKRIADKLKVHSSQVYDIATSSPLDVLPYDVLLLGSSTWGAGDLQDDWYDFLDGMKKLNLSKKKVALFGSGDSEGFPDTFCDALGLIYDGLKDTHCAFMGSVSTAGYTFDDSVAVRDGRFVGLPLDETNESMNTNTRIDNWIETLRQEGLA